MKRGIWLLILTFFTAIGGISLYLALPKFIGEVENIINDSMFVFRGEGKKDDRIVIVDIDEKSLNSLGQWPWSRNKLAKILDNLTNAGVGAVGFDIIFSQEDKSSPSKVVKELGIVTQKPLLDFDDMFAKSIKNSPTVTGFFFSFKNEQITQSREPKTKAIIVEKNRPKNSYLLKAKGSVLSIDKINNSAFSNGFINYNTKFDKVARYVPSVIEYRGILYPSFSIELTRLVMGARKITVLYNEDGVESLVMGDLKIPTDIYGNITINYTGHHPAYTYISAVNIYDNNFSIGDIAGKIALIGTSAPGLFDIRSSPYDAVMPGVEAHAHLIDNILNNNFLSKPQWGISVDLVMIGLLPFLCFFTLLSPKIFISIVAGIVFTFFVLVGHYVLMFDYGVIFHSAILLFEIMFIYFMGNVINYIFEHRQKEFIKTKFANKVSKEVMEEIVKGSKDLELKGDMKDISIFFSDIRNFTTISEGFKSPLDLIEFLNAYMTPMTDIIINNKGTVDKFIGDSIMAYWNAPNALENHADFALKSAIEQIKALAILNEEFLLKGFPSIDIGIGLNAGLCIVGEMGTQGRSDYTCIGDSVNLASRLEGLNKKYKTNIIFSQFFLDKLSNPAIYNFKEIGDEIVKGKSESVTIYACFGYKSNLS